MKLKLTGGMKAEDEIVILKRVPFDATKPDLVAAALKTLGPTVADVSKIVTLVQRTNQALYFDLEGQLEVLQKFFAKYYNHMTWDEIRAEYSNNNIKRDTKLKADKKPANKKEAETKEAAAKIKNESTAEFALALKDFLAGYNIKAPQIKYNVKEKAVYLDIGRDTLARMVNDVAVPKFFKKHKFDIERYDNNSKPPRILLKSIEN